MWMLTFKHLRYSHFCWVTQSAWHIYHVFITLQRMTHLLHMMEMATRETMKTTAAAADPAIRGSCSLSSDLKSSTLNKGRKTILWMPVRWPSCLYLEVLWKKEEEARTDGLTDKGKTDPPFTKSLCAFDWQAPFDKPGDIVKSDGESAEPLRSRWTE